MKKFYFLFLAALLTGLFFGAQAQAATINAASCSRANVQTAITAASEGDTVLIPSGSCTWTTTITIDKAIIIKGQGTSNQYGAGASAPVITNNTPVLYSAHSAIFNIQPTSDKAIRITNVYFNTAAHDNTWPGVQITGREDGSFGLTKIRIDHCSFNFGGRQLFVVGWVYGVADHNYFLNGDISIGISGDDNYAW
jgi:hypothetical protein